ncbi:MAG: hypothetical protein MJ168_06295 [Clostridia bacterium]|nr:hypothetical protein [Clostridia bacterium]
MNNILKKYKALSENGQGLLCFSVILFLNAVAFIVNSFRQNNSSLGESVEYTPRLSAEQAVSESPMFKIISVFIVLIFTVLLFVFLKDKLKKSEEKVSNYFAVIFIACPAFLYGLFFVRHSVEFVAIMVVEILAVMLTENEKFLWLVPFACALGIFMNVGFILVCFPTVALSLCGERANEKSMLSQKKTLTASSIISVAVFAVTVFFALSINGDFYGAVDLTQIVDIALYGASSYDGELPYMLTDALPLILICLPQTIFYFVFWFSAIKQAKINEKKIVTYILALSLNLLIIPSLIFFESFGMILLFNVFSQSILILSLVSKGEPIVLRTVKNLNTLFAKKRGTNFLALMLAFEFIICAFIEKKI